MDTSGGIYPWSISTKETTTTITTNSMEKLKNRGYNPFRIC